MAKAKQKTILSDPRYTDFRIRYHNDLTRYVCENSRHKPTWQQMELMDAIGKPGCRVACASGHGCFGRGTEIMMFDGSIKAVESIAVGDCLMGDDNTPRTVLELKRGQEDLYRFEYMDKTSHIFNESHILCLVATQTHARQKTGDKVTVTVRDWLQWSERRRRTHAIYRSSVDFPPKRLSIPPYILGLWLGDGGSDGKRFTNPDNILVQAFTEYIESIGGKMTCGKKMDDIQYGFSWGGKASRFVRKLGSYGLLHNKHIPFNYLTTCREDRLELLAGLLDSDGYTSSNGRGFEITLKSETLSKNTARLAKSLGLHAVVKKLEKGCLYKGEMRKGWYYRVHISRNVEIVPCRLERRKPTAIENPQRNNLNFGIRSVTQLGIGDYYGFALDGNSKFLGGDFVVLHNSGKSLLMAWVLDWHLRVYARSNAMLTATNAEQCRSVVWKYLDEVQEDMARTYPWQAAHFIKETKRYYAKGYKDSWYAIPKTASKSNPENVAGQHNDNYIVICDEASGIADEIHGVLRGALTHKNNRYVMMSQPTRPTGHFADAFKSLSDTYTGFYMNAEESPIVGLHFINEKLLEYGGHHSPEYQIKVLGRFPDNMSGYLIPLSWCLDGQDTLIEHQEPWGWVMTVDVAEGNYRDSSVWTLSRVCGYGSERQAEVVEMREYLGLDERSFACEIAKRVQDLQSCSVAVDAAGSGRTVVLELESQGITVDRLHWGAPPHSDADRQRYRNLRAYSSVHVREALRSKRLRLPQGKRVIEQASRIPYSFDEMGRYLMMSKDEMRSKGIKSPDIFDTIAFIWLVDYTPVGSDPESSPRHGGEGSEDEILKWATEYLKGGN